MAVFILQRRRLIERGAPGRADLKFLVAPAGYGKTVLVSQIAASAPDRYAYIGLDERHDGRLVRERASRALSSGLDPVFDDAHLLPASGREALAEILRSLDPARSAIVATRTVEDLIPKRTLFDGTADIIDAPELAFTAAEAKALCERFAVAYREETLAEFMRRTCGWPTAVCGALRVAGERMLPIHAALEAWYELHGSSVARFVSDECSRVEQGTAFLERVRVAGFCTQGELQAWHAAGLFVARSEQEYRVLPVVYGVFGNEPPDAADRRPLRVALLTEDMRAAIGGAPIRWERLKDAQLFKYLVLKNGVPATRSEIMRIFWPGRERNIAAQNLRTTCSNIRRAIRRIVGAEAIEHYFRSEGDLAVPGPVLCDVDDFTQEMQLARAALGAGNSRLARVHFKNARDIYRCDLLAGIPQCGFEETASSLRNDFGEAVHRLRTLPEFSEPRAAAS